MSNKLVKNMMEAIIIEAICEEIGYNQCHNSHIFEKNLIPLTLSEP